VSKRKWLIWKTALLCSMFVVIAALIALAMRGNVNAPYVAGQERQGIARSLERELSANASGIRFVEVGQRAGIRFEHFPFQRSRQLPEDMGSGAAWGDYDGDGLPDLFLVNIAAPLGVPDEEMASSSAHDRLFRNRGDGSFDDVTEAAGLAVAHRGMGASWGDYDADGDLDLFVTSYGDNILWENQAGHFVDVTTRAGLAGKGFWAGASWADFDLDGDLDLYVCGYVQYIPEPPDSSHMRRSKSEFPFTLNPSSYAPSANRLFVNRGDGSFEERAAAAGVSGENGRSLAAAWVDLDADGLPDLYVANDVSDNALYRNLGDGSFEDVSYPSLVADYRGSMGIAVGDWDRDLDLDLFLTHWIAQENALYSNGFSDGAGGEESGNLVFRDDADRVGLGQIALDLIGWGTAFVDLDSDGWLDLFVANGSTFQRRDDPLQLVAMDPHLYWNRGREEGFFELGAEAGIRSLPAGVGRGAAFADYDRDGDLDLLIVHHGGPARLFRNDSQGGHWVAFRLRGRVGHPSALGARIVVRSGGQALLREAGAGPSYLSQNDSEVVVGLGEAEHIESVEIRWPGGRSEIWRDLAVDGRYLLEEGSPPRLIETRVEEAGGGPDRERPTLTISKHAAKSNLDTGLDREDKRRFWELSRRAGALHVDGQWAEAAELFALMSELDPRHEGALYDRGNCLLELERYQEAEASFERLLEIDPTSSRAWIQLGILHSLPQARELWDLDAAAACFERAHRINREQSRPLALSGEVAVAQGRLDSAHDLLESAYRMNSSSGESLYLSGYLFWQRGDSVRAREFLERTQRSFATQEPVHGVLGEGDTRSPALSTDRRRAAGRRLFASCLEILRSRTDPPDPDTAYGCVDRVRASWPPQQSAR